MTQWAEPSERGRERGPVAVVTAWLEVLASPRRFFREKVAPGDQAPGLTFAALVVLAAELTRVGLVADAYPVVGSRPIVSAALWVLFVVVLVAPAGIHLTAALQTVILMGTVEQRAGVSETVQVFCYSLAPCVLVGVPSPHVTALAAAWAAGLLVVGLGEIHDVSPVRAAVVAAVPAALAFGYGFGGFGAVDALVADPATVWG